MRKILLTTLLATCIFTLNAQQGKIDYASTEKKKVKSDEAMKDEKQNKEAKFWFKRGELLQDVADVNTQFLRLGMGVTEVKLLLNNPTETSTLTKWDLPLEQWTYPTVSLFFQNQALYCFDETKKICPDPLQDALDAFTKCQELDVEKKFDKKLKLAYDKLKKQAELQGLNEYSKKESANALKYFELAYNVNKAPVMANVVDTQMIYFCGAMAVVIKDYDKAIKYLTEAKAVNYKNASLYTDLYDSYIAKSDSASALATLKEGYTIFPDNFSIIVSLINFYLSKGESTEGLAYLKLAEEKDPKNPSIYFAEGTLFEKINDPDKAIEAYTKSTEVDPNFFNGYYNIGVVYFNKGVKISRECENIEDLNKYKACKLNADVEFKKAVPYMEKAYELAQKEDKAKIGPDLKSLYLRLEMTEKYEKIKAELEGGN
jgi:tetratricopeptide (TPR) repeat protein